MLVFQVLECLLNSVNCVGILKLCCCAQMRFVCFSINSVSRRVSATTSQGSSCLSYFLILFLYCLACLVAYIGRNMTGQMQIDVNGFYVADEQRKFALEECSNIPVVWFFFHVNTVITTVTTQCFGNQKACVLLKVPIEHFTKLVFHEPV